MENTQKEPPIRMSDLVMLAILAGSFLAFFGLIAACDLVRR